MKMIKFLPIMIFSVFCLGSVVYGQTDQQANKKIYNELAVIQELEKELALVKALDSETTVKKEETDVKIMRYLALTVLAFGAVVLSYKAVHAFTHQKDQKKKAAININITGQDGISGTYTLVPAKH